MTMTALAIRKKLAAYIQVADYKKVKAVYALLETELNEIVTLEQYNKELETADKEIENGRYISHSDVLKRKQLRKKAK
jgi:hypothetical protein